MLWNTFHKFVLFHHIQFQLFVLTTTPNLKINATATFQIICNLQKRNKFIMDIKNVSKPSQKNSKNGRLPRSYSSPSGQHIRNAVEPQRAQSQLIVGINKDQNTSWQTYHLPHFPINHVHNGFPLLQQPWNSNFQSGGNLTSNRVYINPHMYPVPSSSGINHQYQGNKFFSTGSNELTNEPETSLIHNRRKPLERVWEPERKIQNKDKKFFFTLMSYNVLAQDLVENHRYLYKHHDNDALGWQVRWVNILKEIGDANPDIICFQEVQESHINGYFDILEKKLGYKSIYKKRTGIRTDGCAIYYKKRKLQLVEYQKVEYFQEDVSVLNRDNVGIVARFVPKEINSQQFVVATTHLLYNPRRQDVRLAQVQNLIAEIDKVAFLGINQDGSASYLPIIITGDFNASPDSAVYEFITRGLLDYENLSRMALTKENGRGITGKVLVPEFLQLTDNCQYAEIVRKRNEALKKSTGDRGENTERNSHKNIKFSSGTLSHPFAFKSVYNGSGNIDTLGTTYQDKWLTVDYIFFSGKKQRGTRGFNFEDKLKLVSRYQLLTKKQLEGVKIPNMKLGSDHFSLIVKFALE
ncbi:hypothetical protein WA026_009446 [Henosepilachna vigintioctopunctata]|uniref:Endonuclease/exonuclease/phosphatase domain-containing protein n=1 Tax=Henosepilachna vigintioctopunctata TaxID=420089 RepID=A0AAW1TZD7_9CUCU